MFPGADKGRDFLWRATRRGEFLLLSQRRPVRNELFAELVTKPFEANLKEGDVLRFELRANATTVLDAEFGCGGANRRRGTRLDIIAGAVVRRKRSGKGEKDPVRERDAMRREKDREVHRWMSRQGANNGFRVDEVLLSGYRTRELTRPEGQAVSLGILDLDGVLTVERPDTFLEAVNRGFGRGKAFGCGLMLIYRMAGW